MIGPITWVPSRVFVPFSAIHVFVTTYTVLPSDGISPTAAASLASCSRSLTSSCSPVSVNDWPAAASAGADAVIATACVRYSLS